MNTSFINNKQKAGCRVDKNDELISNMADAVAHIYKLLTNLPDRASWEIADAAYTGLNQWLDKSAEILNKHKPTKSEEHKP